MRSLGLNSTEASGKYGVGVGFEGSQGTVETTGISSGLESRGCVEAKENLECLLHKGLCIGEQVDFESKAQEYLVPFPGCATFPRAGQGLRG